MKLKTLQQRFEEKFTKGESDECWQWTASRNKDGYGQIGFKDTVLLSHRASYLIYKGDISNLHVCHTCDNPWCVNPSHLFLGTMKDNMEDMKAKGRSRRKISMVQKSIIEDAIKAGYNCSKISRYFKVSPKAIIYIKQRM